MEEMQYNSFLNNCSIADKARLLSVSLPHASAWVSVVPSLSLGLHLDPNEFQTAVKWWLGVNPSVSLDGNPMACPLCPNCALDPLGYHCVTCKREGDATTRHNTLHNVVYNTFQTRPADILITNWDCGTSAAFDITVASPLNSLNMLEAGMYCTRVFQQRQLSTENIPVDNDPKCAELGWRCIPLAVENYGAWGLEALRTFSQVASRLAIRDNTPKSKVVAVIWPP
ncbi:hypothetical protein EMCRGX_G033016 [Ephydatia muelleri]